MKQITTSTKALLLVLLLTAVSSFSFAGSANDLSPRLRTSFRHDFKKANVISSEVHENLIKVTFTRNKTILCAYYSTEGKLLGVVHNILSSQLPVEQQMDLKQNYSNYWITELFELNKDGESCYYVSLQNGDEVLNLRSTADAGWEVYSRFEKN
jgi:hypothetical protein